MTMSASYFDLLKYAATGIASPDMTYYDRMRASTLMGGAVQTLTGIPPLSFKSNGTPLISWSMKGNGSQTGTPTPDNPVMPEFVGVRTANLAYDRIKNTNISPTGKIGRESASEYDLAIAHVKAGQVYTANTYVFAFYVDEPIIGSISYDGTRNVAIAGQPTTFTAPITGYVAFRLSSGEQAMLNIGSTVLPYEPFGYKIPITCGEQTTSVYLGQTQTVRRIKKLVLTGTENWTINGNGSSRFFYSNLSDTSIVGTDVISTHFPSANIGRTTSEIGIGLGGAAQLRVRTGDPALYEIDSWKSWLSSNQPTVWYVLSEPETAVINEPLAKIGDYADELHSEDAGVSIPTVNGNNTLTVDTELQPSEMTVTYRG